MSKLDYDVHVVGSYGDSLVAKNNSIATSFGGPKESGRRDARRARFVPYPHKSLGSGLDVKCEWETRDSADIPTSYDATQRAAFAEGVCIPPKLNSTLHVFSSAEAIECLSPTVQGRNIKLILSGDSYMKQLYIGLADILMSKQLSGNKEFRDSIQREKARNNAEYWMAQRHKKNESFPYVEFRCKSECYGADSPFSVLCSRCMNSLGNSTSQNNYVRVVGAGVHIKNRTAELNAYLDKAYRTIYVSMPSYQIDKVPTQYQLQHRLLDKMYTKMLPNLAPQNPQHPFLDVFQLTRSCVMENCSYDGGHRSRYVNRWKAQLLLNMLCEVPG